MKALKKDLQSVVKSLKALAQKTEKIAKGLDKLEKAVAVKKPKMKTTAKAKPAKRAAAGKATVKKTKELSARDTVLAIIKRSGKGVDIATLMKRTGFKNRKVRDALYSLKKKGKVKIISKGVYAKA